MKEEETKLKQIRVWAIVPMELWDLSTYEKDEKEIYKYYIDEGSQIKLFTYDRIGERSGSGFIEFVLDEGNISNFIPTQRIIWMQEIPKKQKKEKDNIDYLG